MKLYEKLAKDIEELIENGVFRPGERLPSIRQTSQHHRLSITTVVHAFLLLESKGIIESHPQSGYFVRVPPQSANGKVSQELRTSQPLAISSQVDVSHLVLSTLRSITNDAVPLGSPYPDPSLFPSEKINRYAYGLSLIHI